MLINFLHRHYVIALNRNPHFNLLVLGDEGTSTFACFAWCTGDGGTGIEHELLESIVGLWAEM